MTMVIREAKINDFNDICRICCDDLGYKCSADLVKERLGKLDSGRERVFVAEADNKVVGFVHADKYDTLYFESAVNILGLAVASEYRKKGFGRALMGAVEAWAEECNIRLVRLNSGSTRKGAHEFYRRIGYSNEKLQIRFMKEI